MKRLPTFNLYLINCLVGRASDFEKTKIVMKQKDIALYTSGPVGLQLAKMTGFMVFGMVAIMAASLAETVYISFLGTEELAALGFAFPIVMLIQSTTMGLSVGASSVVSRRFGEGKRDQGRLVATHSLALALLLSLLIIAIASPILSFVFDFLGADENVCNLSISYVEIWFFGLPFFAFAMVASSLMRAMGDIARPGYLMALSALLQIAFGPALIFGAGEFSGFGLIGAAIAFVLARTIGFLLYVYFFVRDKALIFSTKDIFRSFSDVLYVGTPAIAANVIGPATMTFVTKLVATYGSAAIAGFSLASRVETMFAMVLWSLSMSLAPFIGQNWGAGSITRVKRSFYLANCFSLFWGLFSFLILAFCSPFVLKTLTDDAAVLAYASLYMVIAPLGMGVMGVGANVGSGFNALGKPLAPLIISICQMLFLTVPLSLLGNSLFGLSGIFIGGILSMLISATAGCFWFYSVLDSKRSSDQISLRVVRA